MAAGRGADGVQRGGVGGGGVDVGAETEEDCRSAAAGEGVILGFYIDDFIQRGSFPLSLSLSLSLSFFLKKKKPREFSMPFS